jgi:hypothetical protein
MECMITTVHYSVKGCTKGTKYRTSRWAIILMQTRTEVLVHFQILVSRLIYTHIHGSSKLPCDLLRPYTDHNSNAVGEWVDMG